MIARFIRWLIHTEEEELRREWYREQMAHAMERSDLERVKRLEKEFAERHECGISPD
jgi:hypothetical protein